MKLVLLFFCIHSFHVFGDSWINLEYQKVSDAIPQPLKGFIPYSSKYLSSTSFPHSMEWFYLGLNEIMEGSHQFTFEESLEKKLAETSSRGKQSVFRIYLDYPSHQHGVPKYLIDAGHKLIKYENSDSDNQGGLSPDYNDEKLIVAIESSIAEMGRCYDGDPRIGFITVGYLGHWGEWHTYPNDHLMAKESVKVRVIQAFYKAFKKTKYMLRYPNDLKKDYPCGLHDDSFLNSTMYDKTKSWNFLSRMKASDNMDVWKQNPIGGEIFPPFQKTVWKNKKIEDFYQCVEATHCSWLLNNSVFNNKVSESEFSMATKASNYLGYEFTIESFRFTDSMLELKIKNKGVAPFYYKWPITLINLDSKEVIETKWNITKVLPNERRTFSQKMNSGRWAIKIANPMKGGLAITFSNKLEKEGWVILK